MDKIMERNTAEKDEEGKTTEEASKKQQTESGKPL